MTPFSGTVWRLAVPVAALTVVAFAVAIAIALALPEPVSSGGLGPGWQCTRAALVFTTCSPLADAARRALPSAKPLPACGRRAEEALLA